MYIVSNLVKVTIPNYLAGLPIPDSIGGWFRLGGKKKVPTMCTQNSNKVEVHLDKIANEGRDCCFRSSYN